MLFPHRHLYPGLINPLRWNHGHKALCFSGLCSELRHFPWGNLPLLLIPLFIPSDPDWASSTLGVFICLSCSGIHRNIPSISKVKSLKMDHWDDAQVQVRFLSRRYVRQVGSRLYTNTSSSLWPNQAFGLTELEINVVSSHFSSALDTQVEIIPLNSLGEGRCTCLYVSPHFLLLCG